jgi:hypothetical protein
MLIDIIVYLYIYIFNKLWYIVNEMASSTKLLRMDSLIMEIPINKN